MATPLEYTYSATTEHPPSTGTPENGVWPRDAALYRAKRETVLTHTMRVVWRRPRNGMAEAWEPAGYYDEAAAWHQSMMVY